MLSTEEILKLPFFFIVGRARSGTTLLQSMLDANSSVVIPAESCVLMHLKNKYFNTANWTDKKVDEFIADVFTERKLKLFWKLDAKRMREQMHLIPQSSRNFQLLCKLVYLNYPSIFEKSTIKHIGDKNPNYSLFLNDLIDLFPEAKFIHLVRDYRGNIASNRALYSIKSISVLANAWVYHNKKIELTKLIFPDRFRLLRYEDLVANPEKEMKGVCDFLNIVYDKQMISYNEKAAERLGEDVKKSFEESHSELLKPITIDKVSAWEKSLSSSDIVLAEFIAGEYAQKYGYAPTLKKRGSLYLYISNLFGNCRNRFICFVVKRYYHAPFNVKMMLSKVSKKMNDLFGLRNYYNQADFID